MIRKVIIGALALFVTAGAVNAQTTQFGVKGGYNLSKITTDEDGTTSKGLSGFNAGLVADIGITEMFSVRTGLDLQSKGGVLSENNATGKLTANPLYLEIPATFNVNFPLGGNVKLYAGAGPYVAFGVGGKYKASGSFWGLVDGEEAIKWGSDNDDHMKRVDGGVIVGGGLKFNDKFGIHTQYGIGLVNTDPGSAQDSRKNNNRTFGVSGIVYF